MPDVTSDVRVPVEDLYEKIRWRVLENDIEGALELLETAESQAARLEVLSKVADNCARDLDRVRARAHAFVLARDEIGEIFNESQRFNRFIIAALERETGTALEEQEGQSGGPERRAESPTQEEQLDKVILVNHAPLTTRVLAQEVLPYLDALIEVQQIITEMQGGTFVEPIIRN